MLNRLKNKKNILVLSLLIVLVVGGTVTYFFNKILFDKTINNKVQLVYCDEIDEMFGDVNLSCTNVSDSQEKVLLRFKYDSYWKYIFVDCIENNLINEEEDEEQQVPTEATELIAYNNGLEYDYSYIYDKGDNKTVAITFDDEFSSNFVYNDGWYYYKKALKPGETVDIVKTITKNKDDAVSAKYNFNFFYESSLVNSELVSEIWNVTYSIDEEDNITWSF